MAQLSRSDALIEELRPQRPGPKSPGAQKPPGGPGPKSPNTAEDARQGSYSKVLVDTLAQVKDAFEFMQLFFPDIEPYRWQMEELVRLSGFMNPAALDYEATYHEATTENPIRMTLCAANGSGKDQIVLTVWALYCICCKRDFHWIGTSSSYNQLDGQTWLHIKRRADELNKAFGRGFLDIKKHKVTCNHTGSKITLFRSDEDMKTEGFHPLRPGAPMAIVLNECKSLEPSVVMAFRRCHGYTHWLNISSPGAPFGYFYEKCVSPRAVSYPAPMIPGVEYFRRVDWRQCPHLKHEYDYDVAEFGEDDPYILSSYKALFCSDSKLYIIRPEDIGYQYPPKADLGLPRRAGLDLALGGDATILSVWEGNYQVLEWVLHEPHEPTQTAMLVAKIAELNIEASQVYADAGGIGAPIIARIREAGLNINGVHNNGSPRNKRAYADRGTELAFNFRRLILDKVLNLQGTSSRMRRECTARFYEIKEGKKKLENKKDFRARCGYSPDRFDAAILAHAGLSHHVFRATEPAQPNPAAKGQPPLNWQKEMEEIYGKLDNRRANAGDWRTSGIFSRRRIGDPMRRANF